MSLSPFPGHPGSRPCSRPRGHAVVAGLLAVTALASVFDLASAVAPASGCTVEAVVRTESGAIPPAGALAVWRGASGGQAAAPVDSNGQAALRDLPCGSAVVGVAQRLGEVGRPDYRRWDDVAVDLVPRVVARVELTMPDLFAVAFRAVDTTGRPAPLGTLLLFPVVDASGVRPLDVYLQLDHAGRATALLEPGRYAVQYSRDEEPTLLAVEIDGVPAGERPAVLDLPGPREVVLRVAPSYRIEGAIRDAEGNGVPGVYLELEGERARWEPFRWPVRDDGGFVVEATRLPAVLRPRDHDGQWTFEPESIAVDDPERLTGWFFLALPDDGARLNGTIVAGEDREPVAGATLVPFPVCDGADSGVPPQGNPLTTDPGGRFEVPCRKDCRVGLRIEPPENRSLVSRTWSSQPGACGTDVEIVLEEGGTVAGTIRGPSRKPVEGIRVIVGMGRFGTVRTGPDGKYELGGVSPGRHSVNLWLTDVPGIPDPVGVPVEPQGFDGDGLLPVVVIEEPGDRARQDFEIVPGGRICVRVADPAGEPLAVERLSVFRPGDEKPYRTQYGHAADRREEPDRLCARRVPPGRLLVRAGSRAFLDAWWPGEEDRALATEVEVEAGKRVEIGPMIARPAGKVELALPVPLARDAAIGAGLWPATEPGAATEAEAKAPPHSAPDTNDSSASGPAVREVHDKRDPNTWEVVEEWTPIPPERIRPQRDPEDEDDRGDDRRFRSVGIVGVPEGTWWLRFCAGEDGCDGEDDYCSGAPVVVERGETTESVAIALAKSGCPKHE